MSVYPVVSCSQSGQDDLIPTILVTLQAMNAIGEDFALNNITISASLAFKDAAVEIPEQLEQLKVIKILMTSIKTSC